MGKARYSICSLKVVLKKNLHFALQILSLLTEKEVNTVLPTHSIIPRTFMLKPGMVLFLGALGRIDFLKVRKVCTIEK